MGLLDGKVALITGGGTGIGKAIGKRFFDEGAAVAICGRREAVLAEALASIAGVDPAAIGSVDRALYGVVDVGQTGAVAQFVAHVVQRFGGLDVVVNNAGIMRFGSVMDATEDLWQTIWNTNTLGPWRVMRAALPHLRARGGGSIVNISSIAGHKSLPNAGVYCTSKAALNMMSQVAALEWAADRIRVNLIAPGFVEETELANPIFGPAELEAFRQKMRVLHPLGRAGLPADVADAALYLASDQSSWMTGVVLPLDGGRHIVTNRPPV